MGGHRVKDSFGVAVEVGDYILSASTSRGWAKIGTVYAAQPSGRLMVEIEHSPYNWGTKKRSEIGSMTAVLRKADGSVPTHIGVPATINPGAVDVAMRDFLAHEDYDLHKSMECSEEDGEDRYPEAVDTFVQVYEGAL